MIGQLEKFGNYNTTIDIYDEYCFWDRKRKKLIDYQILYQFIVIKFV